jgi:hypothetical protein
VPPNVLAEPRIWPQFAADTARGRRRRGLSMASKQTEIAIEKIIEACDGSIRGALEALLLVNEYLEAELHRLYAAPCPCESERLSTVH